MMKKTNNPVFERVTLKNVDVFRTMKVTTNCLKQLNTFLEPLYFRAVKFEREEGPAFYMILNSEDKCVDLVDINKYILVNEECIFKRHYTKHVTIICEEDLKKYYKTYKEEQDDSNE